MMLLGFLQRCWKAVVNTPLESEIREEQALISLALVAVVLGEILLCGIIITSISCEGGLLPLGGMHCLLQIYFAVACVRSFVATLASTVPYCTVLCIVFLDCLFSVLFSSIEYLYRCTDCSVMLRGVCRRSKLVSYLVVLYCTVCRSVPVCVHVM